MDSFYVMATTLSFRIELQLILWVMSGLGEKTSKSALSFGTGFAFQGSRVYRFLNELIERASVFWEGNKVI